MVGRSRREIPSYFPRRQRTSQLLALSQSLLVLNVYVIFTHSSSYLRGGLLSEGILLLVSTLFLSTMAGSITALMKNLLIGCVPNGASAFFFLSVSASVFVYSFYFCLPLLPLATTTTLAPVVTVPAIIFDVLLLYYCYYFCICICYYY